jgi:hypothetical protein
MGGEEKYGKSQWENERKDVALRRKLFGLKRPASALCWVVFTAEKRYSPAKLRTSYRKLMKNIMKHHFLAASIWALQTTKKRRKYAHKWSWMKYSSRYEQI